MKKNIAKIAIAACLLAPLIATAATNSFQGTFWSLSYSGAALPDSDSAHQTYRVTLGVDTNGYTGTGSFIDQVALKVSSSVYAETLVSAPGGVAAWSFRSGGISAGGCSGSGGGFGCVNSLGALNSGYGVAINKGNGVGTDYTWVFDVTVANGKLFADDDLSSIKARFVNSNGAKVGDLLSEKIGLTTVTTVSAVPEPETYAMLMAGLGLMGCVARRRMRAAA